jgi:hypothetical protein
MQTFASDHSCRYHANSAISDEFELKSRYKTPENCISVVEEVVGMDIKIIKNKMKINPNYKIGNSFIGICPGYCKGAGDFIYIPNHKIAQAGGIFKTKNFFYTRIYIYDRPFIGKNYEIVFFGSEVNAMDFLEKLSNINVGRGI